MDWPSDPDLFIAPNLLRFFDYNLATKTPGQKVKVIQNWNSRQPEAAEIRELSNVGNWKDWIQSLGFIRNNDEKKIPFDVRNLPDNGFSILCIPRAGKYSIYEDDDDDEDEDVPFDYMNIPLEGEEVIESWKEIVEAFHLPGHFPKISIRKQTSLISIIRTREFGGRLEKMWTHTAIINPDFDKNPIAMAATYFNTRKTTLAVMFGCSDAEIEMIDRWVNNSKHAIGHPLLMLGIYTELQLKHLLTMVNNEQGNYDKLMKKVESERKKEVKDQFSWELINKVRKAREASKKLEDEVEATKRQLLKAYSSALETLNNYQDRPPTSPDKSARMTETTSLFSERFNDITSTLDSLSARCRMFVEGIMFTTDIIRNEISRKEAQISAENSKFATGISLVAAVYLPLTTMATIFAMPIFQWSNDWRNWRYRPVYSGSTSSPDTEPEGSNEQMASPVVSGYIWIYVIISFGLSGLTFFGFKYYMNLRNRGKNVSLLQATRKFLDPRRLFEKRTTYSAASSGHNSETTLPY